MADTMTLDELKEAVADICAGRDTQRSLFTNAQLGEAIDAAIKQREQGANNPLKGWIFDKVNMGRGDERYICTPDGANATTVRNESTSDHRERLLWLIADAMAKESGNG
ncbi:MAG: hypothetical protein KGL39_60505 [Patescibacteria group bacterium]|nr:hypothetical protein [Patescibacteria group bacterium]